jgi:alternate F1F0 ATPase F0 subunit A
MDRAPVTVPLQTGIQAIDALIPIGRGQRELILGDRQTGKTAIALDTIINQRDTQVLAVYCAIGKQLSDVARLVAELREYDALETCIIVVAGGEDPPGLKYIAPYAATAMAEYFMEQGRDVLVVYDDLTRHARAYRELSLLLRRPPAREAYPGDIFYIHSRLLERATYLDDEHGGGSLTALPIIETQAENMSAYIPTNLISITDGQIYLSPRLFQEGVLPAIDVGKSVSRVGGKTQLNAYWAVTGDLRLSYSQFPMIRNQIHEVTHQEASRYLPFIGTLFMYISVSNLLQVIPGFQPPTGSLSTTAALAVCVFFAVAIFGITQQGVLAYLKQYLRPSPLMLPFNIISELSRTLALAVRLFGNIMSGTLIGAILLSVVPFFLPVIMNLLGLLIGQIQAYIFAILATVYIASATQSQQSQQADA